MRATKNRTGRRSTGRVAAWRRQARGRWIDGNATIRGAKATRDPATSPSVVRVEGGTVLEVYADATVAEAKADPAGTSWHVVVDGRPAGTIVGRAAALAFALTRARSPESVWARAAAIGEATERLGAREVERILRETVGTRPRPSACKCEPRATLARAIARVGIANVEAVQAAILAPPLKPRARGSVAALRSLIAGRPDEARVVRALRAAVANGGRVAPPARRARPFRVNRAQARAVAGMLARVLSWSAAKPKARKAGAR